MSRFSFAGFGSNRHAREAAGLLLIALSVVIAGALVSYDAADASWWHRSGPGAEHNWFGWFGATLGETVLQLLGTAAFLAPIALSVLGVRWLLGSERLSLGRSIGYFVLGLSLCSLLDLLYGNIAYGGESFSAGGFVGRRVAGALRAAFNTPGALLLSATALAASVILTTRISFVHAVEWLTHHLAEGARRLGPMLRDAYVRARIAWDERAEKRRAAAAERAAATERERPPAARIETPPAATETVAAAAAAPPERPTRPTLKLEPGPAGDRPVAPAERPKLVPTAARGAGSSRARKIEPAEPRQSKLPMQPGKRGYALPPLDLLNEPAPQAVESEQELLERAKLITDKLREFSVNGTVVAIHPGPIVTTFEFKPEAGVKYSKITGMTDDLSLALRAESVRIDRMAGRATVGIEVPNRHQETIFPRELFGSDTFRNGSSKLTVGLGKDIGGNVLCAELDRMPHLLIAGATGSGKSVGLNGMIASILYKATPEEVRFIMIDTKMIELGIYADIPHLLIPVVTEAKHAATALKWAVREMEQRYRKLAAVGVRNITQFNDLLEEKPDSTYNDPKQEEPVRLTPLSYIVIVIDELADLMMVTSSEVEAAIMRLAQMARAVGIHLIIATQRPSVDVITGTIKANFPSRIAFRVSQRVDSRTIIDQQGAEHLLGRGDMLYLASGSARLKRVHGSYLTEAEINRITAFIRKMAEPVYDESVLREGEEGGPGEIDGEPTDEFYVEAVRTILEEGKCSITLIQRRLKLGYARAARIVDMMERQGVVSTGEGSKPREILVGPEFLEQLGGTSAPAPEL